MRRDTDFVCDENVAPGSDDGGPEDGHGSAHDGKVDFKAGEDERLRVPEGEVEAVGCVVVVLEGAPETEDCHQDDTDPSISGDPDGCVCSRGAYIDPSVNKPVIASNCLRFRFGRKNSVRGIKNIAMSKIMFVEANARIKSFDSVAVRNPKP